MARQMGAIVDKLLTNVSQGYFPQGYISEAILPLVEVDQYTGKLGKYSNSHLRIERSITGGEGKYRRVTPITREQQSYEIDGHGLEGLVTKRDKKNVEKPYDAEKDEVMGLTAQIWLEKEKLLADTLGDTAIITQNTTLSGTDQFSDYTNSDPIDVFNTAVNAVYDGCGMAPNFVGMDWKTARILRYHPVLLDSLGYKDNRPGGLTDEEIARALGIQKIFVAQAVYNSAKEGQSDSLAAVWGKNIVLGVAPDRAMPYQVSLGYRLQLRGQGPRKVYKYAIDNPPESTGILVEDEYDYLIANAGAGYLIKDAVA